MNGVDTLQRHAGLPVAAHHTTDQKAQWAAQPDARRPDPQRDRTAAVG